LKSTINGARSVVDEPMLRIDQYENDAYKLVCLIQNECTNISLDEIIFGIKQSLNSPRMADDERRRHLSAWINGIDTKNTYETALQYHHHGTCEWVLQLEELQAWESPQPSQGKFLWIHGPPGFGKTFMSAWLIRHLKEKIQGPLSYFFCVADNEATRGPYSILRSWLSQLLDQAESVLPLMDSIFAKRTSKDQPLTHLELWQLFVTVGESIPGCTFVVDGFDECTHIDSGAHYHKNDPRNYFFRDLLERLPKTKCRVLVVSRDVPDIREYLGKDSMESRKIEMYEYKITAKDTTEDVKSFSESMVNERLPKKNASLREKIANQAAERSKGMFLWIKLLEKEISPGQNAKELTETVHEMPSGISEAYSRELEKITQLSPKQKEKASVVLRWILYAVRPLQVKELAEALIVSSDDELEEYPQDDLPDTWTESFVDEDYVKEAILGRCGSLLELRSSSERQPLASHTVHFVHFSVKEYLSSLTPPNPWAAALGLADKGAEGIRLSKICLRYLALDVFKEIPANADIYPFLSYAAWAWYFHGFHRKPTPPQDIMDRTHRAFDPSTTSWKVWTPVLEAEFDDLNRKEWDFATVADSHSAVEIDGSDDDVATIHKDTTLPQSTVQNPIYYASLLGLEEVLKWLEDQGLNCNCSGGRFGFPLQAAVARDHIEVVAHLLNRNVDVSQRGGQFGAAIIAAAATSTPEIMQILLDVGADVTAVDEAGWTALHHASKRGVAKIVGQLLERGAQINAITKDGSTAVVVACANGNKDVLSALIQKGADLELASENGSPLELALTRGHEELACRLLDANISVNAPFSNGWSPLIIAVAVQCIQVVKKLLEKKVDVNAFYNQNSTALHHAAALADPEMVEILLDAGADITSSDFDGATPLHIAAMNAHIETIKTLLQRGASLDQTSKGKISVLFMAVSGGSLEAVRVLLELGASMKCIYENQQETLFDVAIRTKNQDMAEYLVKNGCFRTRPKSDTTIDQITVASRPEESLALLAFSGDEKGVKKFTQEKRSSAAVDVINEALHIASARGFEPIVKTLISSGAEVYKKDINGRTALHHALKHAYEDVANILIENGANASAEDDIGSTPIDFAVARGEGSLEFIKQHMGDFNLHISRRPSVLDSANSKIGHATPAGVREALSGNWKGYYDYLSWFEGRKDSFSLEFPKAPSEELLGCTFSSENVDEVGKFQFHGFVDVKGVVWFVKLYCEQGWLYRGQLDSDLQTLRGTWGSNRKLWFGTFYLTKAS
jgi:ankyrin repeat protein